VAPLAALAQSVLPVVQVHSLHLSTAAAAVVVGRQSERMAARATQALAAPGQPRQSQEQLPRALMLRVLMRSQAVAVVVRLMMRTQALAVQAAAVKVTAQAHLFPGQSTREVAAVVVAATARQAMAVAES
jgi:hypothetical protein